MTPNDWALLSEWVDGGLSPEQRAELEARFAREPELAQAARRLRALWDSARTLGPTEADAAAWRRSTRRISPLLGGLLGLVLLASAGAWFLARPASPPADSRPRLAVLLTAPEDAGTARAPVPDGDAAPASPGAGGSPARGDAPERVASARLDAGRSEPSTGEPPMPLRPDASIPLVAAALVATAAQAGPPAVAHVNPGEYYIVHAPSPQVTVTPTAGVEVRDLGPLTRLVAKDPGVFRVTTTPSDGGTPRVIELQVEARRDPEFTIELKVDDWRELWAPARVRFAVGSGALARVIETGDRLRVEGVAAGETSLEVWFSDGAHRAWPIRVTSPTKSDVIEFRVGQQKVITLGAGDKARLEDATLARVQPIGSKQVLLMAQRPGTTTLLVTGSDGAPRWQKRVVVSGNAVDAVPAGVDDVTLVPTQREQGPFHVRQNRALRFTSPTPIDRTRTRADLLLSTLKGGELLVHGAATGKGVLEVVLADGTEVQITVVVDP